MRRKRFAYVLLILLVMGTGLLWRSRFLPLPPFLSKYGGDALWALLVFFGFGFLLNRVTTARLALVSLAFAWTVEFLQLYHASWIDSIRAFRLGHLVLGSTFNWPDLAAYAVGIAIGVWLETRSGVASTWRTDEKRQGDL
ncbi:DUF2809 domain-containing protein [Luteolibacter yonseiensis]|uniref:DUF2809 domain-containing protein n=1 Tax=Luteolibacter yonseiensis TaxID=1144680 RepID=A0A934R7Z8_9BACT|nr:DUF2809 domain-containing protein [Luteolibacter yonseiensis]MBK1817846.1 DUF2809 domain-containing protein [Luteolibacter yonseiensis]